MATTISNTVPSTRYYQAQSRLLSMMPVEIILDIADHTASVADAVSLALTCKGLFAILSRYIERLDAHSREILLTTLERNISWVVYCPVARKLLPFYSKENIFYYPNKSGIYQAFRPDGERHIASMCPGRSLRVSFLETRLVRNRRLLGVTHGIPLSCLSLSGRKSINFLFMKTQCRTHLEVSRTAKWIGDDLFLSYTWSCRVMGVGITRQVISAQSLHDFFRDTLLDDACYHCRLDGRKNFAYGVLHPSLDEAEAKLSKNSAYEGMGGCSCCETDWDLSISWLQHSLIFKTVTYHDLGCCSIPPDPKWQKLLKFGRDRSLPRESCHGHVRHMWINSG
ncbi:hypothetical protein EV127DRAFT_493144 [Xylaria flabelliformis]|nr:hypothetical protein EV127DRAFT_493144 [Xylaria flabelliformis]